MFQTTSMILFLVATVAAGAFMVRLGCGMVAGFKPSMAEAAKAMGWAILAGLPIAIIMGLPPVAKSQPMSAVLAIAYLAVSAYILGAKLKHPETGPIGMGKGVAVVFAWMGVAIVGSLAIGLVASVVLKDEAMKPGDNYAQCAIINLPKVQNDAAAGAVIQACISHHQSGLDGVQQGLLAGSGKYRNGAECAAGIGASTQSLRAGQVIRSACNKLYDEPGPWNDFNN